MTSFSRSGDMKEIQNIKSGRFGVIWAHKVIGNVIIQYSAYDFLFTFYRKYAYVLYCVWDIVSFFVKRYKFLCPLCILHPVGCDPLEFQHDLWRQKIRVRWVVVVILFSRFDRTLTCDRQTQGRSTCLVVTSLNKWSQVTDVKNSIYLQGKLTLC